MTDQTDTRYEIFGMKINREQHYASNHTLPTRGNLRNFWVLRDEDGYIVEKEKTLEALIQTMMIATCEHSGVNINGTKVRLYKGA